MRKITIPIVTLMACLIVAPAFAWEFSMSGAMVTEYRYATQLGSNGFFGPYDLIAPNPGVAESPNFWHGIHFQGFGWDYVYSSEATTHSIWMEIDPQIRINKAIRIRGRYRVGNHDFTSPAPAADDRDPVYFNSTQPGPIYNFASGQWAMLWATAQTPWGTLAVGKRPFSFGTGLFFDGTINTTTESVLLVAPYGPFRFLLGFYPGRSTGLTVNRSNKDGVEDWEWAAVMTYSSGPLQIGSFWDYLNLSASRAGAILTTNRNTSALITTHYMKYANGRFFVNAEAGSHTAETKINGTAPSYVEAYRCMVESGLLAGPMKVSTIYALATGGSWGDKSYSSTLPNTIVFKPYSLLMVRNYGVGTAFSSTAYEGYLDNAWFLGARADYAIAANLNTWIAISGAWRLDRSSESWGSIHLTSDGAGSHSALLTIGPVAGANRFIPNDDLGWEIYGGLNWELLDGLRVQVDSSYWQPGKWWRHACVSGTTGVTNMIAGGNAGVDWNRTIDPVLAFWMSANFEY